MIRRFLAVLVVLLCSAAWESLLARSIPETAQGLNPEQKQWLTHARRADREGWIYLHIEGGPRERGFQHGYLLAREIEFSMHATQKDWAYKTGMEWSWLTQKAELLFLRRIDAELLAELEGIVEGLGAAGVKTTRAEIIAYNGIIELQGYWWPTVKDSIGARSPDRSQESCSSFIATGSLTSDGGIVLGHNTMTSYAPADCNIIVDIVPARGHRILWQGSPGWIHSGTDFFITDAGLVGSETTISGFKGFDRDAIPEFVRMRRATQDAGSIDDWCRIMQTGNNGGYANAWLLGDVRTNEIARLELGLKHVALERTRDGYFVGSNIAEDVKVLRLETDAKETDIRNTDIARRVRWKQLMKQHRGKIDAALAQTFEGDHYDAFLKKSRFGFRSLCAHWEFETEDPSSPAFDPYGTVDAKVVDSRMARQMSFSARWGSGCGTAFDAGKFLEDHPQFEWMTGILRSRRSHPWTVFTAGE